MRGSRQALLDRDGGQPAAAPMVADERIKPQGEHPLRCRACGHVITDAALRVDVAGKHLHSRMNPVGVLFIFGCFAAAPGCSALGPPTSDATWFEGCTWQFAMCAQCHAHLGWHFNGAEQFVGLVLENLVDDEG